MNIFAATAAAAAKTTINFHDTKHVATNILAVVWLPTLVPTTPPHPLAPLYCTTKRKANSVWPFFKMAAACQSLEIGGKACGKRISQLALLWEKKTR